jgi:fructokinase
MFLICGEVLFDVFVSAERPDGLSLDARPGGSPFNVALGLARLGQPTQFMTGLSRDVLGRRLAAFIEASGVGTDCAVRCTRPTALSVVDLGEDGVPDYAFYGDAPAYAAVEVADLPPPSPAVQAIHVGSIAMVKDPAATSLLALVRRDRARCLVSYDINVRPSIEPDLDIWRRRVEELSDLVHVMKVSSEDLDVLYPGVSPADIAERWLARGARLVVVTHGPDGAQAWTQACVATVAGQSVELADTVGAGDSFQAALLAGLAESGHLSAAGLDALDSEGLTSLLRFATQAAAVTCSRRGADLPRREELGPLRN